MSKTDMTVRFDFRDTSALFALSDGELLAACRKDFDAASVKETARVFEGLVSEAALRLRSLRQGVEREAAKIQPPKRIFVDPQERRMAYHVACRLLVATEPHWQALHESLVSLSSLEFDLMNCREAQGRLEALLEETKRRGRTDRAELRSMEQKFKRRVARAETLGKSFLKKRDALRHLCANVETDFTARLSKIADFENEGVACDPSGCARLCAELCHVIVTAEAGMT